MAVPGEKFYAFITEVAAGTHAGTLNADSDVCKVALFNDAPVNTDTTISDQSGEANGGSTSNGYTAGGTDVANASSTATGTITLSGTNIVWTATGDWASDFRYAVLYNDSQSDKLILSWDYGSSISLLNTETFTFDCETAGSILTLA